MSIRVKPSTLLNVAVVATFALALGIRPKSADRILASGKSLPPEMFEHVKAVA